MFTSYGYLQYDPRFATRYDPWWALLVCDKGLAAFYRNLVAQQRTVDLRSEDWLKMKGLPESDKSWPVKIPGQRLNPPAWGPHISIVRGEKPSNIKAWSKYQGKRFAFEYDPQYINTNGKHWWFRVTSPELEDVRLELGLTPQPTYIHYVTKEVTVNPFHLTIGSNVEAPPSKRTKSKTTLKPRKKGIQKIID